MHIPSNPQGSLFPDLRDLSESETHAPAVEATHAPVDHVKRNSSSGIAMMVQQLTAPAAPLASSSKGVGGRQASKPLPGRGGGYQDKCDVFQIRVGVKKSADPRLDELYAMGMQQYWLDVAEFLGVDAFLGMWRVLDSHRDIMPDAGGRAASMAPTLRPYSNYLKFQKNRFVENLARQGVPPSEIQKRVQTQLCETISINHIYRMIKKNKIKR